MKLNRNGKIYLDLAKTKESQLNKYLSCRDGIVELYEYRSDSGYGSKTRLFLCNNAKHESFAIIKQIYSSLFEEWIEESLYFDTDSFGYLKALVNGKSDELGGEYSLVRDYNDEGGDPMAKNVPGEKCPKCGTGEIDAITPRTVYACGSSDYDQRPGTFMQSERCKDSL